MSRPALHVLFTIDVPAAGPRASPYGPASWEASARSLDAFCTTVLNAGFAPTVLVTPEAAAQHAPMCEELAESGAEIGLLVQPTTLRGAGLKRLLGAYSRDDQAAIVGEARRRFGVALGHRPLSVRSAFYSANDNTFDVLAAAGFRQASTSSPGRKVPKHHSDWDRAASDPHFTSAVTRLEPGDLPLVEIPVTTDATQRHDGIAPDLAIENGTLDRWHAPLIAAQLLRHETERVSFRTLCFVTSSGVAYQDLNGRPRQTLAMLLEHLEALEARCTILPETLASACSHYRESPAAPADPPR